MVFLFYLDLIINKSSTVAVQNVSKQTRTSKFYLHIHYFPVQFSVTELDVYFTLTLWNTFLSVNRFIYTLDFSVTVVKNKCTLILINIKSFTIFVNLAVSLCCIWHLSRQLTFQKAKIQSLNRYVRSPMSNTFSTYIRWIFLLLLYRKHLISSWRERKYRTNN